MSFTTPCFIRKNTPEFRKKLATLGYRMMCPNEYENLVCCDNWVNDCEDVSDLDTIDCGTNESLFLAIAALRDDSDTHQWFIDKENKWLQCQRKTIREFIDIAAIHGYEVSDLRKATVPELIEHFKTEEPMNTSPITQSKQALEERITALVSEFKKEHNLSGVEVSSCTHTLCTEGCFNVVKCTEINVTATINEDGVEIIIR